MKILKSISVDGTAAEVDMEHKVKIVEPDVLMEPLLALLEETQTVPLVISGSSMTPFLAPGRDTVYLSKAKKPLRKGDMVLYRRNNGYYILHRVFKADADGYTMVGDAQTQLEPGITRDQVCAVVTAVRRKGKLLQRGSFWWAFFEKVWIRMVPLRPLARNAYCLVKKLLGK